MSYYFQIARLNMSKYAADERVAKPLFQYIFYHENDVRNVSAHIFKYTP